MPSLLTEYRRCQQRRRARVDVVDVTDVTDVVDVGTAMVFKAWLGQRP